jgi:hypothetical protein
MHTSVWLIYCGTRPVALCIVCGWGMVYWLVVHLLILT